MWSPVRVKITNDSIYVLDWTELHVWLYMESESIVTCRVGNCLFLVQKHLHEPKIACLKWDDSFQGTFDSFPAIQTFNIRAIYFVPKLDRMDATVSANAKGEKKLYWFIFLDRMLLQARFRI